MKTPGTVPMTGISSQVSLEQVWEASEVPRDVLMSSLHLSALRPRRLKSSFTMTCWTLLWRCCTPRARIVTLFVFLQGWPWSVSWPTCFLLFYARYVDNLFSLVEVGQPELAFDDWPW